MDTIIGNDSQKMYAAEISVTLVTATVGASLLALIVVSGNLLVIIAFVWDKSLQSIANSFLVSLACADLLVGGVVIPIFISDMIGQTSSGEKLCYVVNTLDICASSASIFHLCVISGDRYMAIVHPMTYPAKMTRKLSLVLIGAAWGLALSVSGMWVCFELGLGHINRCKFEASFSPFFSIISSCVSFVFPAIFMMIFYTKTFLAARAHIRRIHRGRMALSGSDGNQDAMRIHRGGGAASTGTSTTATALNSEFKAAKTLGLVIGAFLLCWLPFFTLNVMSPLCTGQCNSISSIKLAFTWLGFINSAINPFIYAFTNSSFRIGFSKIICCLRNSRRGQRTADSRSTAGQMNMQNKTNPVSFEFPLPHIYF